MYLCSQAWSAAHTAALCVCVPVRLCVRVKVPPVCSLLCRVCVCARATAGLDNLGVTCRTPEQLLGGHAVTQPFATTSALVSLRPLDFCLFIAQGRFFPPLVCSPESRLSDPISHLFPHRAVGEERWKGRNSLCSLDGLDWRQSNW